MKTFNKIGGLDVEVQRKRIRNLHLRVCPPNGAVRISIPIGLGDEAVHALLLERMDWIKRQQDKFKNHKVPAPSCFVSGEQHYFRGNSLCLQVIHQNGAARVALYDAQTLHMYVREKATVAKRKKVLQEWYREQMLLVVPPLMEKWQQRLGVEVYDWNIKKMRSKWGTCNVTRKRIWLNLDLITRSSNCLEYVLLHELVHLLEASHNKRFKSLMDEFMPQWRVYKDELNNRRPATQSII